MRTFWCLRPAAHHGRHRGSYRAQAYSPDRNVCLARFVSTGLAPPFEMLVAARAMLGFGGAIIMPATLSLVTSSFRDPKERAQAIAIWAAVFGLGIGVGPLLGGYLLQDYEWNAVFLVNLPVVLVALIGGHFFLEESRDENAPSPDYPGVLLSITGLLALV